MAKFSPEVKREVSYLKKDFSPATKQTADLVKVSYSDGRLSFFPNKK